MKHLLGAAVALTVAAWIAAPVQASPVTGTAIYPLTPSGGNYYIPVRGGETGRFIGQLGMVWDEPVEVTSLSLSIFNDPGDPRAIPETVRIYTAPNTFVDVLFTPKVDGTLYGEYFLDFSANPIQAVNSYVVVVMLHEKLLPGYGYWHVGLVNGTMTFGAESLGNDKDVNLNSQSFGTMMSFSAGTPAPNFGSAERTNNGDLVNNYGSNGVLWAASHAGKTIELTATYEDLQTIGSIGLAFAGDDGNRYSPASITVVGTDKDGELIATMDIAINAESALYGRYALNDDFVDVKYLTLQFVVPLDIPGTGYIGIHEFQAFAPIPEPATMSLLALGGLALLRRRK